MDLKKRNSYAVNHRHLLSAIMLLWITMPIVEQSEQALQVVSVLFLFLAVVFLVSGMYIGSRAAGKDGNDSIKLLRILLRDKRGEVCDAFIFAAGIVIAYSMGVMNYVYLWIFLLAITVTNLLIPVRKKVE